MHADVSFTIIVDQIDDDLVKELDEQVVPDGLQAV